MRAEDLILVSVDDHVVEPPDLFEGHLPEKWMEYAPKSVHRTRLSSVCVRDSGLSVARGAKSSSRWRSTTEST